MGVDINPFESFAAAPVRQLLFNSFYRHRVIHNNAIDIGTVHIPQNPLNKVIIAVKQGRGPAADGHLLDALPLFLQKFQILDNRFFRFAFGLGAYQQTHPRRFDQNP